MNPNYFTELRLAALKPEDLAVLRLAAMAAVATVESDYVAGKVQKGMKRQAAESHLAAAQPDFEEVDRNDVLDWAWDTFGPFLNDHSRSEALKEPDLGADGATSASSNPAPEVDDDSHVPAGQQVK